MNRDPGGGQVVIRKRIPATREELFDAWMDPVGMREWMCPGNIESAEVQIEPRVGGSLVIIMRGSGETVEHRGEFRAIERPAKLAFTWTAKATGWRATLVTVEFLEISPDETELVLKHQDIPKSDVLDQYQGGWSQIIDRLRQYLQKGDQING